MHTAPPGKFNARDVTELERAGIVAVGIGQQMTTVLEQTYELGRAYFRLPLGDKLQDQIGDEFGYRPTGIEYSQSPDRPDPIESFSASKRTASYVTRFHSQEGRRLYRQMLGAIDLFEPIAELVTRKTADTLGGDGDRLIGAMHRWSVLQLNYSRPADVAVPFIHEAHEDGHVLTLAAASGSGLEIAGADGRFVPLLNDRDSLLIMPGEILWLLSGGCIRPLVHRVIPQPALTERLALLFFADIDPRQCSPWIANNINAGVDIGRRVLTNARRFGLTGFNEE